MDLHGQHTDVWRRMRDLSILVLILYFGKPLLVPILYGLFLAIVLYPLCRNLQARGLKRSLSITIALLLVLLLCSALVSTIVYQYKLFQKDLPLLLVRLRPTLDAFIGRFSGLTGESNLHSGNIVQKLIGYSGANIGDIIRSGISGTFTAIVNITLIPLYAALILYYRTALVNFLVLMSGQSRREKLNHILVNTVKVYSSYVKGMIMVYLIVGTLNSIGLLLLGVKYAVLFGMLTAIMTIIPYFGIIVSSLLPISVSWLETNSIYYPLGVIAVFSLVQYLEANFIYPYVVGKRINLNILVSLVAVVAGGLLWGVSGMVLFLPLIAVLKIVADEAEDWKPMSILLSDDPSRPME